MVKEEPSEQLSIEMTNETSNDSNKENQPESTTTPTPPEETTEETPTTVALTVENRPVPDSPGKRYFIIFYKMIQHELFFAASPKLASF